MKALIIGAIFFIASCQAPWFDVLHPDEVFTGSQDTIAAIPPDTTAPIVVIDTCEFLVDIDTPLFVVLSTLYFNGAPINPIWHVGQFSFSSDSLIEVLEHFWPQYSYSHYEENGAVAVVVDGTSNHQQFQGIIWAEDLIGQRQLLTAYTKAFYFWGALTFDEAMIYAIKYPSVESFHFTNTNWTPQQNNTYARTNLHPELCKEGGRLARFVGANGIVPTVVDSFELFQWEFVQQFTDDQLIKA